MNFFLSYETTAPATSYLNQLEPRVSAKLTTLEHTHYGDELTHISIISIVLPIEILKNGFYPERKLFQRKSRSADIRLVLDYDQFLRATPSRRYEMYTEHIIDSILTLKYKVSSSFQYDILLEDVCKILESPDLKSECSKITRF